jgi:filamin
VFCFKGFSIEGPSQARIECHDNGDGSANVRYWPTIPGEYAVHILCNDEDIPHSPYMAWIEAPGNFDPNKVKIWTFLFRMKIFFFLGESLWSRS